MKYFNRFLPKSHSRIAIFAAVLLCVLSACYDDTFDSYGSYGSASPYINLTIVDDTARVASRGGDDEYIRNVYTIASEDDSVKFYLIESEVQGIRINREPARPSRGKVIESADSIGEFGIYVFPTPDDGIVPQTDSILDANNWLVKLNSKTEAGAPATAQLLDKDGNPMKWPRHPLDFVAYYPYTAAFEYVDTDISYQDGLYGWVWDNSKNGLRMHPTPRNGMYLYYKVPDTIAHQQDLMASYVQSQRQSPVTLEMKHLLSAIRFETGDKLRPCTIKKISLAGVRNSGYLNLTCLTNDTDKNLWWVDPESEASTQSEESKGELIDYLDLKKDALKRKSYTFDFGEEGRKLVEYQDGYVKDSISLIGDDNSALLLLPQKFGEKVTLCVEFEYEGYTFQRLIDLQGEWKPGYTYTYRLNSEYTGLPLASLYLKDEKGVPLREIRVGFAGGETNYSVGSYMYYPKANGSIIKLPMPWQASIVMLDENGKETPIISNKFSSTRSGNIDKVQQVVNSDLYDVQFGDVDRIEYDTYNENKPATLADMADIPVRTFVMIPKIRMTTMTSATDALRSAEPPTGNSETAPFNLASRGIGLAENGLEIFHKNGMGGGISGNEWTDNLARKYTYTTDDPSGNDINTANCYIVSAPGWYSFPLVYGNAIKDGCINYGAYIFKSNHHGISKSSTSESLNGENQILQYAIRHDGKRIYSPYILDPIGLVPDKNDKTKFLPFLTLPGDYSTIDSNNV